MKVAIFTSEFLPLRGGIGTYAFELARAAAKLGFDVTVYAPDYRDLPGVDLGGRFPFKVIRFAGGRHSMKDLPRKVLLMRRELRRHDYDWVHAADWPFYLPLFFAQKNLRKSLMVHGSEVIEMLAPAKALLVRLLGIFRRDIQIYTNSHFTRRLFLQHNPDANPANVQAEWLGVSEFWFGTTGGEPIRQQLNIAHDAFLILTVGRLTPRKGHLQVVRALALLPDELKARVCYAIVGPHYDATYVAAIRDLASPSNLDVRLLGELADERLRALYGASDVFCLTGQAIPNGPVEGFGLVFLEAAAQGLPSIAGNLGGMAEAVIDNESGLVVDSESPEAIAAAVQTMAGDEALCTRLREGALRRARLLSWQRLALATFGNPQQHGVADTSGAMPEV